MTKKLKLIIIITITVVMVVYWAALAATETKYKTVNYWWQACMSASAIIFGIFGLFSAKQWSWLKSGVGKSVFFISLGLISWGLGQGVWSYDVLTNPSNQSPNSLLLNVLYFAGLPLWSYGIIKLSKASGARYGLRSTWAKILVAALTVVMLTISYVMLVNVARGGSSYFHQGYSFADIFWDLGFAAGDAINLILVLAIYGLSWRYLGGRFKRPITIMLLAFVFLYLADFWFSYRDGLGVYYNGDWVDLLYILTVATFGIGLCLLDPRSSKLSPAQQGAGKPQEPQVAPATAMPVEALLPPSPFPASPAPIDSPSAETAPVASTQQPTEPQPPASSGIGSI